MDERVHLWETPTEKEKIMIAGWHQWADAGSISSGLPAYLIQKFEARKIGEISRDRFFLFQMPGAHHLLRPEVHTKEGVVQEMRVIKSELHYAEFGEKGLVIFLGEEPHVNEEEYAEAFLDIAEALDVKRIVAVGGVYGAMPFNKDRDISCVFSMEAMRKEMEEYAVRFSNYEGGTTIGSYLAYHAGQRNVEYICFHGFVPAYDFGQVMLPAQSVRIEDDVKAWYDILRRADFMFHLGIDLSELRIQSDELTTSMEEQMEELARQAPQLDVHAYMQKLEEEFTENPFMPLDDVWERELGDLLDDLES
ncbi:MAG: PAC2 family protein [Caldilineaceae bacterium]|nr:PAC2 family protein [Caldilineaceae bacterium]MCY4092109.1 PAC2 family protein [Caldilineaceae bacterium]MCY4116750.1 PAC2 family protein [Caldilineaceae bacterium]MDE0183226.1 PAC2 family protein [Caldilineaceae bacterium]MDE0430197.1 PAC2 family protein [Caldilineaceae bacterium]